MARLLVLAACFAGSWATYMKDNYSAGAGDISGSYGGGGYNVHKSGGNSETIEISILVISESKGGAEVQNIAAPMKPPGMKHTVRRQE